MATPNKFTTGRAPRDEQMKAMQKAHGTPDRRKDLPPNVGDCPHYPDAPPDLPTRKSTTDT